MLKHIEDNADINLLIGDSGGLVAVCSKCKKCWTIKMALEESAEGVRGPAAPGRKRIAVDEGIMKLARVQYPAMFE